MIFFNFHKYIVPHWYFHLNSNYNFSYFPDFDLLNEDQRKLLDFDPNYSTREISKLDASFQAWNKGFISSNSDYTISANLDEPTISDNYRFIKKYYHPIWSIYILLLRIITLNNPLFEILGYFKSFNVKRSLLNYNIFIHNDLFETYESELIKSNCKVSIIIPTLNRYDYLKKALNDLENQTYKNFEVIVVDQSDNYLRDFYDQFNLDIKVFYQNEKALWLARNTAIKNATSDLIAMYEDDVSVNSNWLECHLKCLDYFEADISAGVFFPEGSCLPVSRSHFRWADQFATGNACLKIEVFRSIGLFDRQFEKQRMGDGEFGLRAYLAGFKSISNPYSFCIDIKAPFGGLREMGSWDAFRSKNLFAPRPIPSVLYFIRKYFGKKAAFNLLLTNIPSSLVPYKFKSNKILQGLSFILFIPLLLIVVCQVFISWNLATKMIDEGHKIDYLSC